MEIRHRFVLLLILLLAFALRIHSLTNIPPGLTHDEANHAREASGIQEGVFLFYFPLNYGSEPLYSYTVAGNMSLLGENLFALRWVNVVFGLLTLSITYTWGSKAFGRETAVLATALMAVSFWPLASSREALRAGMLPFFMSGAVWFFWRLISFDTQYSVFSIQRSAFTIQYFLFGGLAISIAATLHTYLAARVAWLVFPLFLLYLWGGHRDVFRRVWLPTLLGVGVGWLLATPMFYYVQTHPEASTRLEMLDRPLQELSSGHFKPLLENAAEALLAFIWPGYGDQFLAYNIPGRPVFEWVSAVFFLVGLFACFYHWRKPPYAFLLLWFGTGILPSLITGPTANTTRNLATLSAVYLLPAIGFTQLFHILRSVTHHAQRASRFTFHVSRFTFYASLLWLAFVTWTTTRDYFIRWGESPGVRGAYQHTVVEMLNYLNEKTAESPLVISSVYPGPVHDPSLALLLSPKYAPEIRWVDARYALVLPDGRSTDALIPASTPPHPTFASFLTAVDSITLRPDDLDPGFTLYQLHVPDMLNNQSVNFDNAIQLIGAQWIDPLTYPGETAELLTIWRVLDPARVGPIVPPTYTTDAVLFTHVLAADGSVLAQHDSLEAPSWDWQTDDVILQIHPIPIPLSTAPGTYETAVGIYDRTSGERRPILDVTGTIIETRAFVIPLQISEQ